MTGEKEPSKCFLGDERDEWKFYFITGASEKRNFLIILKIPGYFFEAFFAFNSRKGWKGIFNSFSSLYWKMLITESWIEENFFLILREHVRTNRLIQDIQREVNK